jgi:uncharacterized protein involved in outer membrane biogenesis
MNMKKKLLIVLGAVVVLVVAVLLIVPALFDVNRYHDRIQAEMQKQLGRTVQLGNMSLSLLPPAFKVQNAVIGEDPKLNSGTPFAQTAELAIELKFFPLLHGDVQVSELRLVRPQLELIRGEDGAWNFSTIAAQSQQQPKQQPSGGSKPIQLGRFQIQDGSVAVTDRQHHKPRVQYNNIDVVLRNFAPGNPFDVTVSAHLPGGGKQLVKFEGHGGPIQDATLISTPFEGTLELQQVSLAAARQYMNAAQMNRADASISGSLKFKNSGGTASTNGTIRMENIVVQGKKVGYPVELDYNASDDLKRQLVTISDTKLKVGNAPFTVNGTVDNSSTPPRADLKLITQGAPIADLIALAQAFGAAISPGMQASGNLAADLTAKGALSAPAVAGVLHATQLKVSGVEANSLQINLNMAPPGADVIRTLNGKVSVNLTEGRLTGVDLSQRLGMIGKFKGVNTVSSGATHVTSLTGNFDIHDGVATTNDLKALTDAGTVAATGSASLADETLNMKATAVLSKESSQAMGGASIGGLMSTALTNKDGEIVVPVIVGGTISSPKVEPDVNAIASMKMHNLLPSFSNPGSFTQGLSKIGGAFGSSGSKPGAAAGNQQSGSTMQNAAGAIGGLFGGKKKQ